MLECKPDKLAQNAPANQRLGKPDKLSQGAHKQTSYARVQWENTLDKRGGYIIPWVTVTTRTEKPEKGECKIKEQEQEHRTTHAAGS